MSTRREFLEKGTVSAAILGASALPLDLLALSTADQGETSQDAWNVSWPSRITGKHKALFDAAEVESGYGVMRAGAWARQYMDVLKVPASDLTPVLVLRHNAIVLAFQQSLWDKYEIGKEFKVTHPMTLEATDRNPVLLDEKDGLPAPFNQLGLHKQLARGVVVLACNLALQDVVELVKKRSGASDDVARKEVVAAMLPGVILQPSGVFAAVRAQEAGCAYVRSS